MLIVSVLATNTSCPTWHYYNKATEQCECGYGLSCSSDGKIVEIVHHACATSSQQDGDYYIGGCPYGLTHTIMNRLYSEMPSNASQLDEVMCGPYNRRGLLCGECMDGYGASGYSMSLKCANCSSHWSKYAISLYLFLQFVPTTLIFICLIVFRINITSGPLLGYVLFCQTSMMGFTNRYHYIYYYIYHSKRKVLKVLFLFSLTASQFWNLQFFKTIIPPFCISEKLTGIQVHMLNLVPAMYPLVLVIISCILIELHAKNYKVIIILWKPFKTILSKMNITTVTSGAVFHAFASFVFLSNTSLLYALSKTVDTTHIINSTGFIQKQVIFIDPTLEWSGHKIVPYILIMGVCTICISVIPSVILCIYPTRLYRYLSRFLSARKGLAITAFAEALHSCFKDGLDGTRDYRALAGAPPFVLLMFTAITHILEYFIHDRARHTQSQVMWMMLVCLVSYLKPCKSAIANISLVFHMTLYGILTCVANLWEYDLSVGTYTLELMFIVTLLSPHILVAAWAGYTLTKHTLTRFGYQFHGPGCKAALNDMANGVRLCLCGRQRDYQEMDEQ